MRLTAFTRLILVLALMLLSACGYPPVRAPLKPAPPTDQLSDSEQIAGEIMAYLIEVVLGRAGALQKRSAWASRGLDLPLDFDMVVERMFGPVNRRAELMLLDTNILGLSQVLYHYDRRLNLFKGSRSHDSLYPCAELMAMRLFLIKKIDRQETVDMTALYHNAALFDSQGPSVTAAELDAMGLHPAEFAFLKSVFQSEPAFLRYMRHPSIVSTLQTLGLVNMDPQRLSANLAATYRRIGCQPPQNPDDRPVTVAIVAGMNPMFEPHPETGGIIPSSTYVALTKQIQNGIRSRLSTDTGFPPSSRELLFVTPERPVTIHPQNADRVISQLCPTADFTLIVLGKNVYRAVVIDPQADIYPHKRWVYVDTDDIQYQQIDAELDTAVKAIRPLLLAAGKRSPLS